jgi:hypothetical protein
VKDYFQLPQRNDPPERLFPLVLKAKPGQSTNSPVDLLRELPLGQVNDNGDMHPLIRVFQKHPHIRDAVITALREEGWPPAQ